MLEACRDNVRNLYQQAKAGLGMTEPEWLASTTPVSMLAFVKGRASERKLRLFNVACARLLWDRIPPGELREAVEAAERCADGTPWEVELSLQVRRMYEIVTDHLRKANRTPPADPLLDKFGVLETVLQTTVAPCSLRIVVPSPLRAPFVLRLTEDRQPALIRDIFGNPFHPLDLYFAWVTPAITTLAADIYNNRSFDQLPSLADVLEDAGCDSDGILAHCRGDGPHVRGCWVVDLILGKQ